MSLDSDVFEKLGIVTEKAKAAHQRIDKMEILIREDLTEIINDLKKITEWMNHTKGYIAGLVLAGGLVGGIISVGAQWILNRLLGSQD